MPFDTFSKYPKWTFPIQCIFYRPIDIITPLKMKYNLPPIIRSNLKLQKCLHILTSIIPKDQSKDCRFLMKQA